jgi:hypothetical protein
MWFKCASNTLTLLVYAHLIESAPIRNYLLGDAARSTETIGIAQLAPPREWPGLPAPATMQVGKRSGVPKIHNYKPEEYTLEERAAIEKVWSTRESLQKWYRRGVGTPLKGRITLLRSRNFTIILITELNVKEQEAFLNDAEQTDVYMRRTFALLKQNEKPMPTGLQAFWSIVVRDFKLVRKARKLPMMTEEVERRLKLLREEWGDISKVDGAYCLSNLKSPSSETRRFQRSSALQ